MNPVMTKRQAHTKVQSSVHKFYWNTVKPIHSCAIYYCSRTIMPVLSSCNIDRMCQQSLKYLLTGLLQKRFANPAPNNTEVIMTQFHFPLITLKGKWFHEVPTLREISVRALRTTCLNTEAGLGKILPRNRNLSLYHLFPSGLQKLNMEALCWLKRNQILYPTPTKLPTMKWSEVAQSCPTLCDPSTVAHQAPCPWDSPGKNTGVGCHFLL